MITSAAPTKESKRLVWIDSIRGFAIFGIFIVNVGAFSAPYFIYGGEDLAWLSTIDRITQIGIDIFFQASFYTLFAILFGFGFQIMKERLEIRNISIYPFLIRRQSVLICFGLIHGLLVWHGDILFSYGVVGLLLLFFLERKDTTVLGWSLFLLSGSVWLISLLYYNLRDYLSNPNWEMIEISLLNYKSDSIFIILLENYQAWLLSNTYISFLMLASILLPLFLFGMYIAKKRWLHEPIKYRTTLKVLWIISFILFLGFKVTPYFFGNPLWFSYIQDNIGGTFSAVFYIISLTVAFQSNFGLNLLSPLAAVGRMSLTNYILQSIISFILFYGVGFGLYGSIRPVTSIIIVLTVFLFQIILSNLWMRYFLFGPIEWIWRSFTYMKLQPFRRCN